jgi:hypothetical protein
LVAYPKCRIGAESNVVGSIYLIDLVIKTATIAGAGLPKGIKRKNDTE